MTKIDPIYVGEDALAHLTQYCNQNQLKKFVLVADHNTYPVMGEAVEKALKEQGADVATIILTGKEIVADESYLMQVFLHAPTDDRMFISVGSGTVTDITRMKSKFISVPTAPSVDGFTSIGAPLVIAGMKDSVFCQAPVAMFADINVLHNCPPAMIAAGFGDLLAKITALADWKIGRILYNEPYDEAIAQRLRKAYQACFDYADDIRNHSVEGVRQIMNGLIETGLCMLDFGTSRPASGSEHHISHYWELKFLWEGRPAVLHGAKVGVSTVMISQVYEQLRNLSREELMERLEAATLPDRAAEEAQIQKVYGHITDQVFKIQKHFLSMTPERYDDIKHRIADHWDEIREITMLVPDSQSLIDTLARAGAPTTGPELGLSQEEIETGLKNGHYLRDRFTSVKLARVLGLV
jgi:glycerol-1-phosphate dehydrogenase [NAD(P)+]